MNQSDLQSLMLRALAENKVDGRLAYGQNHFIPNIRAVCPQHDQPSLQEVQEALWALISRGLVFIDMSAQTVFDWRVTLTQIGTAAARDEVIHPDEPAYLSRVYSDVPAMSHMVRRYIDEAVQSYRCRCYLASTVMLGVAAEAAFLELSAPFANWLKGASAENLKKVLNEPRSTYDQKFTEFRKRLDPQKGNLPPDLADGLNLQMNAVLDLLRVARNEAGHPKDVKIGKDDCLVSLLTFPRLAKRMYQLKAFFEAS